MSEQTSLPLGESPNPSRLSTNAFDDYTHEDLLSNRKRLYDLGNERELTDDELREVALIMGALRRRSSGPPKEKPAKPAKEPKAPKASKTPASLDDL